MIRNCLCTQEIEFLTVWQNMRPNCSFALHSAMPDAVTEVSCTVTALQQPTEVAWNTSVQGSSDVGSVARITVLEDMNKVPSRCSVMYITSLFNVNKLGLNGVPQIHVSR